MERNEFIVTGIVQGVGFRPFVANLAESLGLSGFCGNDQVSVFIQVQGSRDSLDNFEKRLVYEAPPLAVILSFKRRDLPVLPPSDSHDFRIVPSRNASGVKTLIPPDVAICADCEKEMSDPTNRRFGYSFITCTNCGPRLSIIESLPYDRHLTTMRDFPMCSACRSEYTDPTDRRFHAQPISCYDCGPRLWLVMSSQLSDKNPDPFAPSANSALALPPKTGMDRVGRDRDSQDSVLQRAVSVLRDGLILAVKGLGGFHLLVDAANPVAVERLRQRKHRDGKPLAIMCLNEAQADCLVMLNQQTRAVLRSAARPIILAPKRHDACDLSGGDLFDGIHVLSIADPVAPGLNTLGVMLAYTPLHLRLLQLFGSPVVATSGNLSSEPLCYTNQQALDRLAAVADAWLLHDRRIALPVEDSVLQPIGIVSASNKTVLDDPILDDPILDGPVSRNVGLDSAAYVSALNTQPVRRSRGYAPIPLLLPRPFSDSGSRVVLGLGAELKNTFTLWRDGMAFLSPHIGDMGSFASQQAFERLLDLFLGFHGVRPDLLVRDLHPGYATTAFAQRLSMDLGVECLALQHHRAHALSLMAESGGAKSGHDRAVVLALDGTGYGDDSQIWGSEVFVVDLAGFQSSGAGAGDGLSAQQCIARRVFHLPYFPLVGGDLAVREPWRLAVTALSAAGLDFDLGDLLVLPERLDRQALFAQLSAGMSVNTDSVGRYFDAASALLGFCTHSTYEAHAPVLLQQAAERALVKYFVGVPLPELYDALFSLGVHLPKESFFDGNGSLAEFFSFLVFGLDCGTDRDLLALVFHVVLARFLCAGAARAASDCGIEFAGLTGGSVANGLLVSLLRLYLQQAGLGVFEHCIVPANDGGLSLGQAYWGLLYEGFNGV